MEKLFRNKVVYLAGPYSPDESETEEVQKMQRNGNVFAAREIAIKLWKLGAAVICPHLNSFNFDNAASYESFILGYLKILERCDILVMLPNWQFSNGSRIEHQFFKNLDKPVYYPEMMEELFQ